MAIARSFCPFSGEAMLSATIPARSVCSKAQSSKWAVTAFTLRPDRDRAEKKKPCGVKPSTDLKTLKGRGGGGGGGEKFNQGS
jgi:hypothetical protein